MKDRILGWLSNYHGDYALETSDGRAKLAEDLAEELSKTSADDRLTMVLRYLSAGERYFHERKLDAECRLRGSDELARDNAEASYWAYAKAEQWLKGAQADDLAITTGTTPASSCLRTATKGASREPWNREDSHEPCLMFAYGVCGCDSLCGEDNLPCMGVWE